MILDLRTETRGPSSNGDIGPDVSPDEPIAINGVKICQQN